MTDFIREIPSDSTVQKIEIENGNLTVYFNFDIEVNGKIVGAVVFENIEAIELLPGWQGEGSVEGIAIKGSSALLEKTKNILKEDDESEDLINSLKSYQIGASEKPFIEIIAQSHLVK